MEWYNGTIPAAIQLAKKNKVLFVVYISGNDDVSKEMDVSWDSTSAVQASKSTGIIAIKIDANSDTCAQFSAIFPVVTVPATYFIGNDGVPIDVIGGAKTEEQLSEFIQKVDKDNTSKLRSGLQPANVSQSPGASGSGEFQSYEGASALSASPVAASAAQPDEFVEEKARKAREVLDRRRELKAQKEQEKQLEKEKERRDAGKNMAKLNEWKNEKETKEIQEKVKKDKEENKLAKEKIKEQIARDREERNVRYHQEKSERDKGKDEARITKLKAEQEAKQRILAQKSSNACIQFRMADGSFITQQFASSDTLGHAQQFVVESLNRGAGTFRMCMAYPRREFTANDMSQSMADLGLAPSAAIMILPPARGATVATSSGNQGIFAMLVAPFFSIWNFCYSFLFGQATSSNTSLTQPTTQQPGQSNPRKKTAAKKDGNVHRLTRDDDDDMNTWNGNSTQQM